MSPRRSRPRVAALLVPVASLVLVAGCRTTSYAEREADQAALPEPTTTTKQIERVVVTTSAVEDLQVAFKRAIDRAGPAVVSIYTTKTVRLVPPPVPFGHEFPFELFEFPPGRAQEFTQRGLGSGVIFDAQGHILTNNHVVAGADEIRVKLADEREFGARVLGSDPPTDLALVEIVSEQPVGVEPAELGDSDALEVGDWVVAIGDPYGLPQTVSVGIVSAKGRATVGIIDFEDFIQTDAAINPGNSGGPLVDLQGRVVGISTAIASRGGGSEGIAFAIPVNMAKVVVEQLLQTGKVTRGNLGVVISPLSEDLARSFGFDGEAGLLVQDVVAGSGAAAAGLRGGDIITRLDGEPVADVTEFRNAVARRQPGTSITLEIWRAGRAQQIVATLGEAPSEAPPAQPSERHELGLELDDATPQLQRRFGLDDPRGVVITSVAPGSPAAAAGLRPGDVLEQIGDDPVEHAAGAARRLRELDLRRGVRLRIRRGGVGQFVFIQVD
ncbi:MAG: Do family serine endopeptidase [Enhygromyxa sp.]